MVFQAQNPDCRNFIEQVLQVQPFKVALGLTLSRAAPGEIELPLEIRPDHLQHGGVAHDGVNGALTDNAAEAA